MFGDDSFCAPAESDVARKGSRGCLVSVAASLYSSGHSLRKIAAFLGISHMTVYRLLKGRVRMRPRLPE